MNCQVCGMPYAREEANLDRPEHKNKTQCISALRAHVNTLLYQLAEKSASDLADCWPPRYATDPTGVELVNRFNAMSEALRMYGNEDNWCRWTLHREDGEGGKETIVQWSPDLLHLPKWRVPLYRPWTIAQKALGMVEDKA